jgi:hypothetical protein
MSGSRLAPIAAIAIACTACLPTGPDEYDGPEYALTPGATAAVVDSGNAIGVADAAVTTTPQPNSPPIQPPSTPPQTDAGTTTADSGTGGSTADSGTGGSTADAGGAGLTTCQFAATTTKPGYTGGTSYRAYVLAIWVQNESGALVRTFDYFAASKARYLLTYAKARGSSAVDSVSGASISNLNPQVNEATWDLKDRSGNRVPDGRYTVRIEATSGNGQGPVLDVPFTLSGGAPVDATVGDTANVSAVRLTCN